MATDTPPFAAAPNMPARRGADPLASLAAVRRRHLELLKESRQRPPAELPLQEFVENVHALGKQLDTPTDREAAQSILDYWTATAHTTGREATGTAAPALLADFDENLVKCKTDAADAALKLLSEGDAALADRLLLRLVEFAPDGRGYVGKALGEQGLRVLGDAAAVERVLTALRGAGVIRDAGAGGDRGVELSHQAMVRTWPRLQKLLDRRRRFRDAVRYWDQHARLRNALISGDILEEAIAYADTDDLEKEFIAQSRVRELRHSHLAKALAVLFALLALYAFWSAWHARGLNKTLDLKNAELDSNIKELAIKNKELDVKNADLEKATKQILRDTKQRERFLSDQNNLTGMIGLTRVLAELGNADGPEGQLQAQLHWELYRARARSNSEFSKFLKEHGVDLETIVDPKNTDPNNYDKYSRNALNLGRKLVAEMLRDAPETTQAVLKNARASSFAAARLCADQIVSTFQKKPFADAEPLVLEFRMLYWAELSFVEGRAVEIAMVKFGGQLDVIDEIMKKQAMNAVKSKVELDPHELSWFNKSKQIYSNAKKILAPGRSKDAEAALLAVRQLKVPSEAANALVKCRQELGAAMDTELKGDVVPVSPR